ncbi:cysteine--tRNA ligase [Pseudolysinimonas kribbensis]|uniref:Cysteine--tRNA ligase n=1 Tax=Pseudolysinimonas kribbensis TaxID=433641 RepID=A0ABQ6K625_9MICO|nr:cysteine--tRNA ligase [Pseudolysinimonas kribbensis]GMA95834.1 cysteine--tRNA ligase [Pseudolysinimonas kribbensis]
MTIRLYDTREQQLRDFTPLVEGEVGLYVCGPTVQSSPHIGHLRSALVYDLWRRWFEHRGYRVRFIRNVTDIDDKILANESATEPWWAVAYRVETEFSAAYRALGIREPTYEPRATGSVPQMLELIQRLIDGGHAYVADDDTGDVYFDTTTWPDYGALTRQRLGDMAESADAPTRGKRDPHDFALWKGAKAGEPASASWPAPWGADGAGGGRPGWHIECSAMSRRYLGDAFDIHGGGLDLRFPHHENELAQSSALGFGFAQYWVHNGLVNVEGQKMSKSLGNSVFAGEVLGGARPIVVRYYLASAHYRSTIDYQNGSLAEAEAAFERIEGFLARTAKALEAEPATGVPGAVPEAFAAAMDDDLGTPQAFAVLHETVRAGNAALDAGDLAAAATARAQVLAMTGVLGIDPTAPEWATGGDGADAAALGVLVERLLDDRARARAAKDFGAADRIRDELADAGIVLEDAANGTQWSVG